VGTVSAGAPLEEEASPQLDHSASLREQLEQRYLDPAQQMSDAFLEEQRKQSAAQKAAAVEIAAASGLSEREGRVMWDSVQKPLLRVGKVGVQKSHMQSLRELVRAHLLVKVQLNTFNTDIIAVGRELADGSGAALLQSKGRTLLFGGQGAGKEALLEKAQDSNRRQGAKGERKLARKAAAAQDGTSVISQLPPAVMARLRSLVSGNVIKNGEFDNPSVRALADLPEREGLSVLTQCTKAKLRTVRNKSAWLTSQCKRLGSKVAQPRAASPGKEEESEEASW